MGRKSFRKFLDSFLIILTLITFSVSNVHASVHANAHTFAKDYNSPTHYTLASNCSSGSCGTSRGSSYDYSYDNSYAPMGYYDSSSPPDAGCSVNYESSGTPPGPSPGLNQYPPAIPATSKPCAQGSRICLPPFAQCASYPITCANNIWCDIKRDFWIYFQPCNLLMLSTFLGLAAISANTGFDRSVSAHWQREIRSSKSDNFFKPFNDIGSLSYWYLPLYLGAATIGAWRSETFMGNVLYYWGYRSFRTGILSLAQQIPLAYLIGSGRPNQHQPSKWQPFKYKTGVSGHAVFGAIPFLTAAYMTDPPLLRFTLIALSTLPGLARVNFNVHYFSQVLLGWSIAFLSARAVYLSDMERASAFQVSILPKSNGAMVRCNYDF